MNAFLRPDFMASVLVTTSRHLAWAMWVVA